MKKKILAMIITTMILTGCGAKEAQTTVRPNNDNEKEVPQIGTVSAPIEGTEELVSKVSEEENYAEETELTVMAANEFITGNLADENDKDNLNYFITTSDTDHYYVGMEESSFLEGKEYDRVIYLSNPAYLIGESKYKNKVTNFVCSDEDIAEVIDGIFYPKKQGIVTLTAYNNSEVILEEVVAVTTYNDGKGYDNTSFSSNDGWAFYDIKNPELWKEQIHTIMDMANYLQYRHWCDELIEPDFPIIDHGMDRWQWMPSGDKIACYNTGVSIEVAQAACYMLEDDYEDWGVIWVFGKQGSIFNWFYEDGYYYVFDFTEVTVYNCGSWNENTKNFKESIHQFSSVEEIEMYIKSEKVDIALNPLVVMLSCQGHDSIPAWLDGATSGFEIFENATVENPVIFGWEDVVVDHDSFHVLWKDNKYNIDIKGYSAEEIPAEIREQNVDCMYSGQYVNYFYAY